MEDAVIAIPTIIIEEFHYDTVRDTYDRNELRESTPTLGSTVDGIICTVTKSFIRTKDAAGGSGFNYYELNDRIRYPKKPANGSSLMRSLHPGSYAAMLWLTTPRAPHGTSDVH